MKNNFPCNSCTLILHSKIGWNRFAWNPTIFFLSSNMFFNKAKIIFHGPYSHFRCQCLWNAIHYKNCIFTIEHVFCHWWVTPWIFQYLSQGFLKQAIRWLKYISKYCTMCFHYFVDDQDGSHEVPSQRTKNESVDDWISLPLYIYCLDCFYIIPHSSR